MDASPHRNSNNSINLAAIHTEFEMAMLREKDIQSAIDLVNGGATLREATEKTAIPYGTLWGRLHGATTRNERELPHRRLSPAEESLLADWARNEEGAARPPSKAQISRMAQQILAQGGDSRLLGKQWVNRFLDRHKNVKIKTSRSLDQERRRGSTKEAYEDFFHRLKYQIDSKNIPPRHISNVDEHGMQEAESTEGGKVIGDSLTSRAYKQTSKATTWVSVIESVTAEGRRLTPVVVFTGASLQGQWYPDYFRQQPVIRHWKYDYSPTGFSNERIALKWLNEIYLPETRPENPAQWRLLILDEASSHITEKFMLTAFLNKVHLLYLPPHTSHKTQPLDRSVFSPLKTYFRQETAPLAGCRTTTPLNKQRWLLAYRDASIKGCTARNIRSGFKKTGIWPFDPAQILEDREALVGDSPPPPDRSPTPTNLPMTSATLLKTPQRSRDIYNSLQNALQQQSPSSRNVRSLLIKVGKALDEGNARRAILEAENARLHADLAADRPYTKKRVREPANDKFASMEAIAEANEASMKPPTGRKRKKTVDPPPSLEDRAEEVIHVLHRFHEAEEMQ